MRIRNIRILRSATFRLWYGQNNNVLILSVSFADSSPWSPRGAFDALKRATAQNLPPSSSSVGFADSFPSRGSLMVCKSTCLPLWGRWPSEAKAGEGTCRPSQSPAATALPKGEPRALRTPKPSPCGEGAPAGGERGGGLYILSCRAFAPSKGSFV